MEEKPKSNTGRWTLIYAAVLFILVLQIAIYTYLTIRLK